MKKTFEVVGLTFVLLAGFTAMAAEEADTKPNTKRTQLIILGTLHGGHFQNPSYGPNVLKEILLSLKPDAILNESSLSEAENDGRPICREIRVPEFWASDRVATQLGIRQIPYDRPERQELYRKTRYYERQKKSFDQYQAWAEETKKKDPENADLVVLGLWGTASSSQMYFHLRAGPEIINSNGFDSVIRIKHTVYQSITPELLAKYPGNEELVKEFEFFGDEWRERNEIMADNILKAAREFVGDRLVVLTGSEHRYILRDLLEAAEEVELKEYWQVVDVDLSGAREADANLTAEIEEMKQDTEAYIQLAGSYWKAVIRGDWAEVGGLGTGRGAEWCKKTLGTNLPVEIVEIGQPRRERSFPTGLITPCKVKFEDGQTLEFHLIISSKKVDGKWVRTISRVWRKGTLLE